MPAEGKAGVIDDTLVHRACDQGVELAGQAAVAGAPQAVQDIGRVGGVEVARLAGVAQGHR